MDNFRIFLDCGRSLLNSQYMNYKNPYYGNTDYIDTTITSDEVIFLKLKYNVEIKPDIEYGDVVYFHDMDEVDVINILNELRPL